MDVLGCMNRVFVNWNSVNLLLHDIRNRNFVMNFIWMRNFDFFDDRHLNDFDFWNSFRMILMLSVMWIRCFYGSVQKKKRKDVRLKAKIP